MHAKTSKDLFRMAVEHSLFVLRWCATVSSVFSVIIERVGVVNFQCRSESFAIIAQIIEQSSNLLMASRH